MDWLRTVAICHGNRKNLQPGDGRSLNQLRVFFGFFIAARAQEGGGIVAARAANSNTAVELETTPKVFLFVNTFTSMQPL